MIVPGKAPIGGIAAPPVRVFVSYSHENASWSKRLQPLLKVKANVSAMRPWHDTELKAGDQWDAEIRAELQRMDIFLCLVSYDFLASEYITGVELPEALRRCDRGEVEIVPLLVYPVDLDSDCPALKRFNPLPVFNRCWRDFERDDGDWKDALYQIGTGLKGAIEKIQDRKISTRP